MSSVAGGQTKFNGWLLRVVVADLAGPIAVPLLMWRGWSLGPAIAVGIASSIVCLGAVVVGTMCALRASPGARRAHKVGRQLT